MWKPLLSLKGTNVTVGLWKAGARILEALGAEEQALRLVHRAVKAAPDKGELHLHATRLCLKRGKVDQAILHWRKAAGEQGRTSLLYWLRRSDKRSLNRQRLIRNGIRQEVFFAEPFAPAGPERQKASGFFKLFKNPPGNLSLNDIGIQLLEMGRLEEALLIFRKVLDAEGNSPALCFNLGLTLSKLGRHREALEFYERAQAGGLNSVELLNNKGYSLSYLQQYEEAIACYELAKEMSPGDGIILANLASCYHRLKQYKQALSCYENAARCLSSDPVVYNNYALCLEELGRHEEALRNYDRALELAPGSKNIQLNKAVCLQKMGCLKESMAISEEILRRDPGCAEAWGLKGNLLREMGHVEEAARCYGCALGLKVKGRQKRASAGN
ncbi:MAG: tetratricopeptide repeat protein [Desulfotomaculales bacterium]